ncbi:hypothetical protein KSF_104440 [Reticulibacter mediterranei]|uniref:DDE domain-containing protein n=1 Tax=Reticulibacter mediterranei TaxID=2778369 RepID=A0A8J3J2J9_9CHLR|nr:hypothetical protein KSF_104440 [Reticulibacter mediterranei]
MYRAVDSQGNTLEFLLSPTRDTEATLRFFLKTLVASHTDSPRVSGARQKRGLPQSILSIESCELQQVKYLNNLGSKTIVFSSGV